MNPSGARFFHDLRAPLARAQTYAKLLEEAAPADFPELLAELRSALADLERIVRAAESDPAC